jgi:serine/threonine protein kinase
LNDPPAPEMRELLRIFERVADALAHMHSRGVIHADLKPKNLIYAAGTGVKVIDFGLAWVKGEPKGRLQGTPQYMAPETSCHKLINERTDIYNLGATMYRLVAGHALPRITPGVVPDEKTFDRRLVPVYHANTSAPLELCELIHWCIRYNPDQRPRQMNEIQSILSRLAGE